MLKHTRDAEVTDLDLAALRHEYVLRFEVSVQDFAIVDVFDGESHLHEPIEDLVFAVAH